MEQWLLERLNGLFDTLLDLAVFALIALLPVSLAVKATALLALILGLYALINLRRWSAHLDPWAHAGKLLRRVSVALTVSSPNYPPLPAPREPRMLVLDEATRASLPPLKLSNVPGIYVYDTAAESKASGPGRNAALDFPLLSELEGKGVFDRVEPDKSKASEHNLRLSQLLAELQSATASAQTGLERPAVRTR